MDGKKELNFELDLLPVISMMSVCICFLLLTAVWTQVGSMNVDQGLGQESTRKEQKASSLWITMKPGGEVKLTAMDAPQALSADLKEKTIQIGGANSAGGLKAVALAAEQIKRSVPGLKTALIMADQKVNYGDVIQVMDRLKRLDINEIGVAPL